MKKSLFALFGLILLFSSCEIGMGKSVDLEAPILEILSPEKMSYTHLKFELNGTCTDNIKVTDVVISNTVTGQIYGYADIIDDTWSFQMDLPKEEEGEITLLCEAKDAFNNSSTRSARRITLIVDEHAPEGLSWYVDRGNNNQTPLREKEFLENLDLTRSENKDYPQNEKFTIYSTFYDAMNIDTITLKLFDDEISSAIPLIEKTVRSDPSDLIHYIGEGKSIYSPSFTFTHDELVSANPSLASGKHYLRLAYYAKDNDTLENYNETNPIEDTQLYIMWYPESDSPGIGIVESQLSYDDDGEVKISVGVGSHISIDFFDDDGLKKAYCSIRKSIPDTIEAYTKKLINDATERAKAFDFSTYDSFTEKGQAFEYYNDITRDSHGQVQAPDFPGQMYLVSCVYDVNKKWNARIIPIEVTDNEKPLLFIESPSENTTPETVGSVFSIKGYSLDKKGSDFIRIVYVPDTKISLLSSSASKEDRAKQLLEEYATNTSPKIKIAGTGEVIWYQKFARGEDFNGWKKQSFDISMDLLNDFVNEDGELTAKDNKFFEIQIMDSDNNPVYKQFIISGDSVLPSVDIISPKKELEVHDFTQSDLEIKFKGVKNSGLGMDLSKYKVTTKIGETQYEYTVGKGLTVDSKTNIATLVIPVETLNEWSKIELQPTFTFYATDVLGNGGRGEGQRSVIFSPRPVVNSITIDKNNGTYKKGDVLNFKVSFSKQVKVTGKPRLIVKYSAGDTIPKYAEYEDGSGSNVLTFAFVVPEGADSQQLICQGFDLEQEDVLSNSSHINATELGEGDIFTSIENAEVLVGKVIKLDGISPIINKITVTSVDGITSCSKDKEIKAVVETTENILVSGNPTLILKVGSSNINFSFQKMNGKEITFIHTVKNTDKEGLISYRASQSFSLEDAKYIKDEAGNSLSLTSSDRAGDTLISIDYTAPSVPPKTGFTQEAFNNPQVIKLTDIEENAVAYYSKDGGVSWTTYNPENLETIYKGSYKIVTRQSDLAGNMSKNSDIQNIVINNIFTPITGFNVDIADGYYSEGTEFTFTLNFDEDVIVNSKDDVKLNFESIGNSSIKRSATLVVPPTNKTTALTFTYAVNSTDFIEGVKVTSIDFSNDFSDTYGNVPDYDGTPKKLTPANCSFIKNADGGYRAGISLDGIAPTLLLDKCNPKNGGISTIVDSNNCNITLVFSEKVFKEEGEIILQRKGNWAIPAVMTSEEFRSVYNKMSVANREKMMITETKNGQGNEALDAKTGQPVGPYKKIVHGLKLNGTKLVPDTSTKYVLDFQYDLYSGTVVSDIRQALKSIDYDKHSIDVNSPNVVLTYNSDGTTSVKIKFDEKIEDGREWNLIVPGKAFRDNSENFFAGITIDGEGNTDTYSLWSNKVATPVVRLDRYSHGYGASEPYPTNAGKTTWALKNITTNDIKFSNTKTATSGRSIEPTGYARVRIDCETPDVSISYITKNNGTATASEELSGEMNFAANSNNKTSNSGRISEIEDVLKADLEFTTTGTAYTNNSFIYIGDGSSITARKDYVSARATKTNFANSNYGYEGIFKTVIYTTLGLSSKNYVNIEGGTAPGGEPSISAFPLRDGTDKSTASPYSKNAYIINDTDNTWVTYEIVSTDFSILPCRNNHSSSYGLGSYGQCMYIMDITWEADG